MNKSSLSLLAAGLVAAAGLAHAETFDSPQQAGEASTMTQGVPNAATTNSPYADGTPVIVGAPTYTTTTTTYTYHYPSSVALAPIVIDHGTTTYERGRAPATTNVPDRAGEASTMTHGVPNASTNNHAPGVVVGTSPVLGPTVVYRH